MASNGGFVVSLSQYSHFNRKLSFLSLFVFALLLAFASRLHGSPADNKDETSVFSLFNLKDKSRFWSESVIHGDFDDLGSSKPEKSMPVNYTKYILVLGKTVLSLYNDKKLGSRKRKSAIFWMEYEDYIELPLKFEAFLDPPIDVLLDLNFVSGNSANYLKLQEVDSIYLPVPVNFIFIGFEGRGNQEFRLQAEELERWFSKIDHIFHHTRVPQIEEVLNPFYKINVDKGNRHAPVLSHVNYNFSVHAIQMSGKITYIFERALAVLSRKDDVSEMGDDKDVLWQVDMDMMEVLFNSVIEYLQIENAYNIFILNPKRNVNRTRYGYRRGLSDSEIELLKQNRSLQAKIRKPGGIQGSTFAIEKIQRPLYRERPKVKFAWTATEEIDTVEFSIKCSEAIHSIEKYYEGKDTDFIIQSKVLQLLSGKSEDLKLPLEKFLRFGHFNMLRAECLTDTWIGKDRWAFIDLSAGPFAWGPAVGGQGVRTDQSLPNVTRTIGAVAEISEQEAEDRLQDAIQERFALLGGTEHEAIDILLAEIDIYELFYFRHCKGRRRRLALCEELNVRMRDLKTELQTLEVHEYDESYRRRASDALKRIEGSNLFRETYSFEDLPEFQNYTVARDNFLAHLGSIFWGSMRHIVAPSMADGTFRYYEQISYQLYFITHDRVESVQHLPVDLKSLKDGLSSLSLSSQKVIFSQQTLGLSNDPALAMAFSLARRAAAVPILFVNGTYIKTISNYLDSSIIQHQLRRLDDHSTLRGNHANSRSILEVPIFWFINGDPLLVDKHYQAKALSDMIIVVQSETSSWESHLQCNGRPVVWNLRRPIKAAIAAAAEHLAGLLPHHLVYSHAHQTAIEDWTWSVGCSPFSITSQGWRISQLHKDAIARNYIITSLEESIQIVNSAIHHLALEKTTQKSFKLFHSMERKLVNHYNLAVTLWRRISHLTGELHYDDALRLLYNLDDASKSFAEQVNLTIVLLHPVHCMKERNVEVLLDLTTVPVFLVVMLVLWVVLIPKRTKPKIN